MDSVIRPFWIRYAESETRQRPTFLQKFALDFGNGVAGNVLFAVLLCKFALTNLYDPVESLATSLNFSAFGSFDYLYLSQNPFSVRENEISLLVSVPKMYCHV